MKARWWGQSYENEHTLTIMDKYKFHRACRDGNLALAKQIYYDDPIDPRKTIIAKCFYSACMHGHFEVAQWIYELGNVNIGYRHNLAFRWAIENEDVNIATWLIHIGIDLSDTDWYFTNSDFSDYYQRTHSAASKIQAWFRVKMCIRRNE